MKICLISLGCDKNLVDSEHMLGLVAERGYTYTDDEKEADIIIVNTCCFILDAKQESVEAILETAKLKREGKLKALIVTGCMAQRYQDEIKEEIPEVDALLGTSSYDKIAEVIDSIFSKIHSAKIDEFLDLNRLPALSKKRYHSTGGCYAYLKIAEGCDKHCTYCIIPSLRGNYRSYPIELLLDEARQLANDGIKELILVAQETTVYGKDIYGYKALPKLLKELCAIEGFRWIRILYCYPEEIDDELIDVMTTEKKVCRYLDIPIQHSSDKILRRMGRKTSRKDLVNIINRLRKAMPDIILRTTLITGFPGEEDEDIKELISFVKKMKFERLGVFCYSMEEGTPAADFDNQVDDNIKESRKKKIMKLQMDISKKHLKSLIDSELDVLIEGRLIDEDVYVGRTYMDTPGVDGYIFINSKAVYMNGDFVKARITGASEYDLIGEIS
ncbi:MiaB-like tRNA modifying enzyme YliG [Johnsonella ignava ATCC 51276]|uniref:Ribosomal protein uS12 methylthiotransferase RimO n=1 Tax=Johnsonella ignava ATCC 51276 TaxID=679200 RepID=G5GH02_9FIRM|nr:30S ribosomal protein S12 methylthiotransferase RimO [Johnsonella ignava]EHI56060.1 MiaB-like tRNA modifying enzyme YliG [Johnsonella ignava ATCC 51276]